MSARHTRTGHLANQLHDGTLFVAGEWHQSTRRRPGAHRLPTPNHGVKPPVGQVRVWEANPDEPHRACHIGRHTGGGRYQDVTR